MAPGSLPFTRAPIIFFSSPLCFTAIFGHRSLFYGMDFRNGMVSQSGCFYSHIAAPCLVSCPMIITGRCMVLRHLDSSRGLIGCQDSSPQAFFGFNVFTMHCRALLGLKNGVEGMFTSLFTSLLLKASSFFLSVFIFLFMHFCTFISLVRSPVLFLGSVWQ